MPVQTKSIKRRIKSVKNTRKITKAMELVAASKMRRAVQSATGSRPFSRLAWEVVRRIAAKTDVSKHPLLAAREGAEKTLLVVIASDRGLAGGYNANLAKRAAKEVAAIKGPIEAVTVGRRAGDAMKRLKIPILAAFSNLTNAPAFAEIRPIATLVANEFLSGHYARVKIVYTDFVSALTQTPTVVDLLPLSEEVRGPRAEGRGREEDSLAPRTSHLAPDYLFEPDPLAVLDRLLPRIVDTAVYQAVLEASASEHSARMLAMKNASEAAGDMIDSLTFAFNQARQAGITQEIAEISSGKAALES